MAGETPPKALHDYFTLQRGTAYMSRLLEKPGPVLLGLASIQRNGGFRSGSLRTYGGDSPKKLLVQPGELYVSLKDVTQSADLLGAVARLPIGYSPGRLTQDTVKLVPKHDDISIDYIYCLLRTPQYRNYCRAHATGTTNLGLPRDDFLAFAVPELTAIRQRIINIILALDDKIELNRRMNETLEAMARALFKDWFVDFGPTRAKAESRDPYLAPEIWDQFSDKLDEDGKPEGWEDGKVEDYLELAYGKSLPARSRRPGGVAVYGSGGITGFHDEALIKGPAIIVGRKGTVGSLYWEDRPIFPIDTVFYVVPKRAALSFCYQLLLSQPLAHMNTDAAVPGLNRNNAYRLEFPWPGSRLTNTFESFASPLWKKRTANLREIDTLSQSRDLLLPKLMSGEIRVDDADKIVKEFT